MPTNLKIEVDDLEENWTFQHQFNFIHCRYPAPSITDWAKLIRQCFDATNPGADTEFQEYDLHTYSDDGSLTPSHAERQWNHLSCSACISSGQDPRPGPKIEMWDESNKGVRGMCDVLGIPLPDRAVGERPDQHLVSRRNIALRKRHRIS